MIIPRPPRSPLFPYTTLFRSSARHGSGTFVAPDLPDRAFRAQAFATNVAREDAGIPPRLSDFALRLLAGERSEEHTSELQSRRDLVCRLLLEKKNTNNHYNSS